MLYDLRPYQLEALDHVESAVARGVRRQMGVAATGLGKTIMFCALAERWKARTLILAHRDELITQAANKVQEVWPEAHVGVVKAGENNVGAQVVVASVQTLARERRRDELVAHHHVAPFDLVVVDEAHHSAAESYRAVLEQLGAGEAEGPVLLGVTATPGRGDKVRLDDLYEEIVFEYPMLWGIQAGYLSDLRGLRVTASGLNLANVKTSKGDFDAGSAGRALEDADVPEMVARAWVEHAQGRRTLVFMPTVETASQTRDELASRGVRVAMVHGALPRDERRAILRDYALGRLDVVSNCMVLTEGFDDPRTDCIVVGRPTKNQSLYVQMVGRGTRRHPDKADCLVMDVVGVTDHLSLVTLASLFGIDAPEELAQRTVLEAVTADMEAKVQAGIIAAREVELFKAVRAEGIAWVAVHLPGQLGRYVRSITVAGARHEDDYRETVVVVEREDGWLAGVNRAGDKRVLVHGVDLSHAQGVAEDYVRAHSVASHLHRVDAGWRLARPTDRQRDAARKWDMPVDPTWNAGQLSDALEVHIARRTKVVR